VAAFEPNLKVWLSCFFSMLEQKGGSGAAVDCACVSWRMAQSHSGCHQLLPTCSPLWIWIHAAHNFRQPRCMTFGNVGQWHSNFSRKTHGK